uniref:Peptidase S1 domain-containing protein n=1 Tax=Equus caballus TaxID=9796 RepID=A0A9L0SAP5_HORSE
QGPSVPSPALLFFPGEIIGGHEARPHSCPYMALVQFLIEEKKHRCGGPPTSPLCFLCSSFKVTLGAHDIEKQETTQQNFSVKAAIPHPDYNPKNYSNDIMLLKVREPPLCSYSPGSRLFPLPLGPVCRVAGWGRVTPMGSFSDTLQAVELTVQQDRECESYLRNYYNSTTQLCVGDPKEKKSSFKGDSGGPLVCKNVIHGIVSYGRNNGTPPRAFTKVSSFLSWIKKTMKSL